jgi:uncharacterized protein (DUF2461 family)
MQLDADAVRVGGGFHAHDKAQTARYRAAVDDDRVGGELVAVLAKLARAGFTRGGDAVKTRPRGVDADHPRLELMRHESLTVHREIPPHEAADAGFAKTLAADWRRIRPLVEWCRAHVAPS